MKCEKKNSLGISSIGEGYRLASSQNAVVRSQLYGTSGRSYAFTASFSGVKKNTGLGVDVGICESLFWIQKHQLYRYTEKVRGGTSCNTRGALPVSIKLEEGAIDVNFKTL